MKEEALKLADEWDWMTAEKLAKWGEDTQAMIRRLVEELDKHKQINGVFDYYCDENIRSKQTKPLSDEEIIETWFELPESASISQRQVAFARAIEERHGIK